jgi:dihydrofolate reductase
MGKTVMTAVVSLDGFIADEDDRVGPLFDWFGNGDVEWSYPGGEGVSRTTQPSADFMRAQYRDLAAIVVGRRLFDLTNGWGGQPPGGEHVFVVTHQPPADWEYADSAPFTFVGGVEEAIAAAREFAGDGTVDVAAGEIGGQALKLGLIDQVLFNQVPVVFGSGRPFFATGALGEPLRLENPSAIVPGDRVTHLLFDVSR